MTYSAEQLSGSLDPIADAFKRAEQTDQRNPSNKGWGQFLDVPRGHAQVGSYGTAAGCIVMTLAQRSDQISTENINTLASKWTEKDSEDYLARRSVQTLRIAFLYLALRLISINNRDEPSKIKTLRQKEENILLNRVLGNHSWGDWWFDEESHDRGPSIFSIPPPRAALRRDGVIGSLRS